MNVLSRYIDLDESNFNVHSIQLAHLLLAIGSEIDITLKKICSYLDPKKTKNIDQYKKILKDHRAFSESIELVKTGYLFEPWSDWKEDNNPTWWKSYNNIKHNRDKYFKEANLGNVLNALGGLYLANLCQQIEAINTISLIPAELESIARHVSHESNLFRITDPSIYLPD
ncbi:hypothetical protein [Saccharospirillum mangrovi]|uniref:hypothetical protein n=1 Tax=Saccharospirillum mangrovi TaxID=2161747 RepID=UPI00130017E4|nr:hypothetical protein [Saccharospirillum mangrovi]